MGYGPVRLQPHMSHGVRSSSTPLSGRRIVVTRAQAQARDLGDALTARGAEVILAPTIRIEPLAATGLGPLRAARESLGRYRWVVFTSQNTVRVVFGRGAGWGIAPGCCDPDRDAAVGPATAAAPIPGKGIGALVGRIGDGPVTRLVAPVWKLN